MGSPHSSFIFLLFIINLSIHSTEQASADLTASVRTPWMEKASDDMGDSGKDFPTPRPSPRYQPGASWARHRLLRGRAPGPDADRPSPRRPLSIAAASFPRTQ
ncbi:hypothetical protein HPB48_004391 [Haemaphysalis longicornis]|uniref:Uncharacterized protein n=1 Tax=Haemaphysalis longicornis TaxID=44386 RepID=A0A9J6G3D6_HAELO|nr:hypothetical protein HPB48_004391 [Haemaphysalis longicornis]